MASVKIHVFAVLPQKWVFKNRTDAYRLVLEARAVIATNVFAVGGGGGGGGGAVGVETESAFQSFTAAQRNGGREITFLSLRPLAAISFNFDGILFYNK